MRRGRGIGLVGAAATALACSGLPMLGGGIVLEHELDDAAGATAVALLLTMDEQTGSLPDDTLEDCADHGDAFTWLAARREEPREIAAALQGMAGCADTLHPPDQQAVVLARLDHDDPLVVGRALQAAEPLLGDAPPDSPVVQRVARLVAEHPDDPVRYEALGVLDAHPWARSEGTASVVLGALDDDSHPLVSEVLRLARTHGDGLVLADGFAERAAQLAADHIDPGIRGRAVLLVASLDPDGGAELAAAALDDDHPYTRAAAAEALADIGDPAAVHVLVEHVDDPKEAVWTMLPWSATDGSEWVQHHTGSPLERVDDGVLRAIEALTAELGDDAFVYREVSTDPQWRDLDIVAATRDARRWYEAHRDVLPEG